MVYGDFKDLTRRTAPDKMLRLKAFDIDKAFDIALMVCNFFHKKKLQVELRTVENENISNKELAGELHKPIIKKSDKRKVHSPFKDNIWGADLSDMQLISKFNKRIRFFMCY